MVMARDGEEEAGRIATYGDPQLRILFAVPLMSVPALLGFAFATTIPVVMTLLSALAPDDRRAAFMSLNGTVLRLGQTLGPVVMTVVFTGGGYPAVYVVGAVLAVGLAVLVTAYVRGVGRAGSGLRGVGLRSPGPSSCSVTDVSWRGTPPL